VSKKQCGKVHTLQVAGCELDDSKVSAFKESLSIFPNLIHLELLHLKLPVDDAKKIECILAVLLQSRNIQRLKFEWNN
jgi:hypothetical protein